MKQHLADEVLALGCGRAFTNTSFPHSTENNHIVVESFEPAPDAAGLITLADRVLAARGLHRRIDVYDAGHGARLEPGFVAAGWRSSVMLSMAQMREPSSRSSLPETVELSWKELVPFEEGAARGRPGGRGEDAVRQLVDRHEAKVEAAGARFFGVLEHGQVVSACHLYSDGRTAQVEFVNTMEAHRSRGYARATCMRAVAEARAAGHDFVFLVADADYFAVNLYASLGFDEIGRTFMFDEPM